MKISKGYELQVVYDEAILTPTDEESNDKAIVDLCAFIGKNTMVSAAEFEIINN